MLYEVITESLEKLLGVIEADPGLACVRGRVARFLLRPIAPEGPKPAASVHLNNAPMLPYEARITSYNVCYTKLLRVVLFGVFLFFRYTPVGLAMRAAAQDPASARLVGIRVGWMLALGWGLAAAIGAVAGMMVAPIVFLEPRNNFV